MPSINKEEKKHLDRTADLGCCICGQPAEIHHVRRYGEKRKHTKVIPLCPRHHRTGKRGTAIHAGKAIWVYNHGNEEDWLKWVESRHDRR